MKLIKRWLKIVIGAIVTVVGIILMPVPGPGGTPVTLAGLAILGSELPWAKRLMENLRERTGFLRSGKNSRRKRIGIIAGILVFYAVTGVILTRMWAGCD